MGDMSVVVTDCPVKISLEDLSSLTKSESGWIYKENQNTPSIHLTKVHIQGEICKTAGFNNEILIVDDGTAKAKVTRGSQVPGDLAWVNAGVYCSVVGTLLDNGKLPHITAIKIAKVTNHLLFEMWPLEVKELKNLLTNKISHTLLD